MTLLSDDMMSFYEGVVAKPVELCFLRQNPNIGYRLRLLCGSWNCWRKRFRSRPVRVDRQRQRVLGHFAEALVRRGIVHWYTYLNCMRMNVHVNASAARCRRTSSEGGETRIDVDQSAAVQPMAVRLLGLVQSGAAMVQPRAAYSDYHRECRLRPGV